MISVGMAKTAVLSLSALVLSIPAFGQPLRMDAAKTPLAFEVATIKRDDPGKMVMNELRVYPGGRLVIHGHSLRRLVMDAFDLPPWAVTGGDRWVEQQGFDIEAKPAEEMRRQITGGEYSNIGLHDARIREMLQTLLSERFH